MDLVGRVAELWRYPVSSVGGERVRTADICAAGVVNDRQYGLIDVGSGLPAAPENDHRWRKALHLGAKCVAGSLPVISFPDGETYSLADPSLNTVLSDYFGFGAGIAAHDHIGAHPGFPSVRYRNEHFPMHLLTKASLETLAKLCRLQGIDSRRFRPTVLIEGKEGYGFVESDWIGRRLRLGAIDLIACDEAKRCGITFISQPGIEDEPEILRNIVRHNKRNFGIYCSVESAGTIHLGDELLIETP